MNDINPEYLKPLFIEKECPYYLESYRTFEISPGCIDLAVVYSMQHGLKSFSSYGAKIYGIFSHKIVNQLFLQMNLKSLIKTWNGPNSKYRLYGM